MNATRHSGRLALACLSWALAAALAAAPDAALFAAEVVYWTAVNEYPHFAVRRSGLDFADVEDIAFGISDDLQGIEADAAGGAIYWVERGATASRIVRADLDGAGAEPVFSTSDYSVSRIALDAPGNALYFTASSVSPGDYGIWRLDLESRRADKIITAEPGDLAVDGAGGRVYWVQEGQPGVYGTDIWSADLDGGDKEPIIHHDLEHHTTGIALDLVEGKIYWATADYRNGHVQVVQRADLDGANVEPVTRANPGLDDWPVYVDLDLENRMVYWVNGEDGEFYRVSFDGGEAEFLHDDTGDFGPFDIVVVRTSDAPPRPSEFRRGDADASGEINLTDPIFTLGALFLGTEEPSCADAADVNNDGAVDIADAVASLVFQFLGGFAIPPPGPFDCGGDPALPADDLGCAEYAPCAP
jgi:hypothetical protein